MAPTTPVPNASGRFRVAAVAIGVAGALLLAGCSTADVPRPSSSPSGTGSASPGPTRSPSADATGGSATTGAGGTSGQGGTGSTGGTSAGGDSGTGGTGSGSSGSGSGGSGSSGGTVTQGQLDTSVAQAMAAAGIAESASGSGTLLSLHIDGDDWTIVTADESGAETQSVVSRSLGRVTSGPFPKSVDAATTAQNTAIAAAARVPYATAASTAQRAVPGSSLTGLQLGGTSSAPRWTATVTANGVVHTVVVDAASGAVVSTS
ncbi:PepSY domain-containing protein [Curtobacterium sp. RRHDQ10]|uniref:PepSY domain-containing protein n=1 Tax=Curtobacterium phyllosphaerae TaxID=3413379 RepID=UPI003BEFC3AA